ncbi:MULTISPECIES: hypothetical protein [unclassified Anabaena]|uniref:hypothetical protein n=1 Tax=unclassified Anabaena TaxID=2619674 RepID=UPI001446E216|nr:MULTISPECIES: hypothetical protein [unclassified Anabaena]MTJ06575.1 hypothetical protein [Anabaena sp. UHCC 0204]MTJ54343.1 hypothetical protein [Anabaena sp. UHCC 0253]
MKKLISTVSLIITCISIVSCGSASSDIDASNTVKQSQTESSPATATQEEENNQEDPQKPVRENLASTVNNNNTTTKNADKQPKVGIVKELVNGDLLCYVTLVDEKGIEHNVGATFEICEEEKKFLNKKIRAVYEIESVSDCESIEPCGKTRQESIITKMEVVNEDSRKQSESSNSQTLSNGEWTITLGNTDSWNGVNGTGNVSYQGCDANGKCLKLTGGKISCRDGKCVTGWVNGDYVYILEQPITEEGNASPTLRVRKDDNEILKATGFKVVSGN